MFQKLIESLRQLLVGLLGDKDNLPEGPQDGSDIPDDDDAMITDPVDVDPDEDEAPPEPHEPRYMWCIDNGHGALTPGKRSPVFDDGETQLFEYEFNRDIVRRIKSKLDERGVKYFEVVPEEEIGDFLQGRVERANNLASTLPKLFVSVHSNAGPAATPSDWTSENISGIETWHYHSSEKGIQMAEIFQKHLILKTGFKNRGLKSFPTRQFYVLRKTKMPAVLTENGFFNNKSEALELMKDAVRENIAEAHVAAIVEIEQNGLD